MWQAWICARVQAAQSHRRDVTDRYAVFGRVAVPGLLLRNVQHRLPVRLLVFAAGHALHRLHELNPRLIGAAPACAPAPGDHIAARMDGENNPMILMAGHHLQGQGDQVAPD